MTGEQKQPTDGSFSMARRLCLEERVQIEVMAQDGCDATEIAVELNRGSGYGHHLVR